MVDSSFRPTGLLLTNSSRTVSILVVVDSSFRLNVSCHENTNSVVSILVVVDSSFRLIMREMFDSSFLRFQSLLWWIRRLDLAR